jgi:hypothetical protein
MSEDIPRNLFILEVIDLSQKPLNAPEIGIALDKLFDEVLKPQRTTENIIREALRPQPSFKVKKGPGLFFLNVERDLAILERAGLIWREVTHYHLTPEGLNALQRFRKGRHQRSVSRDPELVFIASAFGHRDIDQLFSDCFLPACEDVGCKPLRIDFTEPRRTITDAILEKIDQARIIIADLTYARQSVYLEVGYALGLGLQLVLTCRFDHRNGKQDSRKVHFDLAQFKISWWKRDKSGLIWTDNSNPKERLKQILGKSHS